MKKGHLGILVLVIIGIVVFCGMAHAGLNDGLVAYYPLSGNANDASGHGHNGTVQGANPTTDRFGNPNSAYYFDGINDYITVPDDGSFNVGNYLTISLWIKFPGTPPSVGSFVSKSAWGVGANTGYIFPYISGDAFGLIVYTGGWGFGRSFRYSYINRGAFPDFYGFGLPPSGPEERSSLSFSWSRFL